MDNWSILISLRLRQSPEIRFHNMCLPAVDRRHPAECRRPCRAGPSSLVVSFQGPAQPKNGLPRSLFMCMFCIQEPRNRRLGQAISPVGALSSRDYRVRRQLPGSINLDKQPGAIAEYKILALFLVWIQCRIHSLVHGERGLAGRRTSSSSASTEKLHFLFGVRPDCESLPSRYLTSPLLSSVYLSFV